MTAKKVRFYELHRIQGVGNNAEMVSIQDGFWSKLHDHVAGRSSVERQIKIRGREAYGEARAARRPAAKYFYFGGVRSRSEWPDSLSERGTIGDLRPADRNALLIDPTYLLPFGHSNMVAVLNMSFASPRITTIESWVTALLGKDGWQGGYTLIPVINRHVVQRLQEAGGATVFRVKIGQDAAVPVNGGGQVGAAARAAKQVSSETDIELGWTLAHRAGSVDTKAALLEAARWIRDDWVKSAKVNLELPDGERLRRKQYDLVREQFTTTQRFDIKPDERPDELSVLTGMNEAIESFKVEFS